MRFIFLTFNEVEGAVIGWEAGGRKDPDLIAAARAAGFSEAEVSESPVGTLKEDFCVSADLIIPRGARALIGDNGSTLLELVDHKAT